jgi:hypothetical protein
VLILPLLLGAFRPQKPDAAWLTITFISFGLFAPRNAVAIFTLFVCATAVSGAIFLTLELYSPLNGLIRISSEPLRNAILRLGQ